MRIEIGSTFFPKDAAYAREFRICESILPNGVKYGMLALLPDPCLAERITVGSRRGETDVLDEQIFLEKEQRLPMIDIIYNPVLSGMEFSSRIERI